MKKSKLRPLLTGSVLLIPAIFVLSNATKTNAMLRSFTIKIKPMFKVPGVSPKIPALNQVNIKPKSNLNTTVSRQPSSHNNPETEVYNGFSGPRTSVYQGFNGGRTSLSGRNSVYENFEGAETGTYQNLVNPRQNLVKIPAYNPNKGPAPKPPTNYEAPQPLYENVNFKLDSKDLARRPLPSLPKGAKNLGNYTKVLIKDGKIVNPDLKSVYENLR